MVQRAEIKVERFDNGYALRWFNVDNNAKPGAKTIAYKGEEPQSIGNVIWNDITDIFEQTTGDEIVIKLEYTDNKQ